MGHGWTKFTLLMWKNWILQKRHPFQTAAEILIPVLFMSLLVIIRSLVYPVTYDESLYDSFTPVPAMTMKASFASAIAFSPIHPLAEKIINDTINKLPPPLPLLVERYRFPSEEQLIYNLSSVNPPTPRPLAGISFDAAIINRTEFHDNMEIHFHFPGEIQNTGLSPSATKNWMTDILFPIFETPGPRERTKNESLSPGYYSEMFLALQDLISRSIIEHYAQVTPDKLPSIRLQRFPYPNYYDDPMIMPLQGFVPMVIVISFVCTCVSTVKVITTEKEKQLKEAMKIMGLPNWLHWTAWFLKSLMFTLITIILTVFLLKIKWYSDSDLAVLTHSDGTLLFVFLLLYMIASICFCFMVSVFFSKANTAAAVSGFLWFISYMPYVFLAISYENLNFTDKIFPCLASNTAMSFGFFLFMVFEGNGQGLQWDKIWKPVSPNDGFSLGHVMLMLVIDAFLYLLITWYVEAVFPGKYGVPKPWYFFIQKSYWCGGVNQPFEALQDELSEDNVAYEKEPSHLKIGIQIINLRKDFGKKKVAVQNLTLNMYEGQITVLLGHNGAGKTTTMSMLTGLITPTSGTAIINGFDIRKNIEGVRDSLGICPQYNVLFDELSVKEHLYFFGKLKGLNGRELEADNQKYISLLQLTDKTNALAKTLSGGMQRKLSAGIALCGNSKVVMFDEPSSGVDPAARRAIWDLLNAEKYGRTMLLTTHFMDEADLLGDRIAIMAHGKLQCCGSSFFLKKKYGAGYNLTLVKEADCNTQNITDFLRKYIPSVSVKHDVGTELTYLLYEDQAVIFEKMFKNLENQKSQLRIQSYGVCLTTMEEVFMKVINDENQHYVNTSISSQQNGNVNLGFNSHEEKLKTEAWKDVIVPVPVKPEAVKGCSLFLHHLRAMLMKKYLSTKRNWIFLVGQAFSAIILLTTVLLFVRTVRSVKDLPPLDISLDKYDSPKAMVGILSANDEINQLYSNFKSIVSPHQVVDFGANGIDMEENILKEYNNKFQVVRHNYIVAASFEDNGGKSQITGWFNDLPYHSPPLALNLIENTVMKIFPGSSNKSISLVNAPLPFTKTSMISYEMNNNNTGFQIAFNIGFSMSFVAAYFVLFSIKERTSKAKLLQLVSGVNVFIFWGAAFLWDFFLFVIQAACLIVIFAIFNEEYIRSPEELGRVFVVFLCFGFSMLPLTYLSGFLFKVPSTGYTIGAVLHIFTGCAGFLVVTILRSPELNLESEANIVDWVLMILPHYSLSTSILNLYMNGLFQKFCIDLVDTCGTIRNVCCKGPDQCPSTGCVNWSEDYFDWETPGIGRNISFFIITGILYFFILFAIEFQIFETIYYCFSTKRSRISNIADDGDETTEDSDVLREKEKICSDNRNSLIQQYTLLLQNFTKYYGNFRAVDKLCLGVKRGECFGLLGVNGAGKTSTFKMLTGDEKISSGDAFVNGLSLKSNMKKVRQIIGYCPQFDGLLEDLTGRETLHIFCLLRGIPTKDCMGIVEDLANELFFMEHIDKLVREYSGGNKRKLSTAVALIGNPHVVYLDEPTTGMDPVAKRHLWNVVCKERDSGKCIILTSHSMEECEALCTRLAIMVNGKFKCLGSIQHIKSKFAEGYTLSVKVKKRSSTPESIHLRDIDLADTLEVKKHITKSFPGAVLREEYESLLTYYIANPSLTWSEMFGKMEKSKKQLNIEDYSIGQTSLEQVFLTFTKHQRNGE